MKHYRVGVISGGFSGERAVSLRSGRNISAALRRLGHTVIDIDPVVDSMLNLDIDVAFIALHGAVGEDGTIQALLDHLGIPYTGSGVSASVIAMNKLVSKWTYQHHGIPTARFQVVSPGTDVSINLQFPLIIKPINEGSSLGIEIVDFPEQFQAVAERLTKTYGVCLVEEVIQGTEITVSVVDQGESQVVLPILELRPVNRFYDYDAKYTDGKTQFVLPAELSDAMTAAAKTLALRVHQILGCRGMSRTDMIVDPVAGPIVLETNTIPGMTDLSDLPAQAKCAGISFDELVEGILAAAVRRLS